MTAQSREKIMHKSYREAYIYILIKLDVIEIRCVSHCYVGERSSMSNAGANRFYSRTNKRQFLPIMVRLVLSSLHVLFQFDLKNEEPHQFGVIDLRLYNYFVIFDRQIIFSSTLSVESVFFLSLLSFY